MFAEAVDRVAARWRRLTPRAWAETVDGRSRADLAYELLAGWTGGRPLPRPAYPAAYPDMLLVLAREVADEDAAAERLAAYDRMIAS